LPAQLKALKENSMKLKTTILSVFGGTALAMALLTAPTFAADKTYQVTGPVLEVTDTSVTVQKGKEKWQIARDKDTKITGELKVGAKVTIQYRMTADTIEAKADGKAADAKAAPAKK
jgi:hypothetical protein